MLAYEALASRGSHKGLKASYRGLEGFIPGFMAYKRRGLAFGGLIRGWSEFCCHLKAWFDDSI